MRNIAIYSWQLPYAQLALLFIRDSYYRLASFRFQQLCILSSSLRSWRYCVGARLKFRRRSRVPKKGSRDEAVIATAPPPNLTRLLHNTTRYAGYLSS